LKNIYAKLLLIPLVFSLLTPAWGQSIEETLKDLVEGNAKGYLSPLATAFGTGLNSGVFHQAKPHKILGFDVTMNFSLTTVPDAGLTYDFYIPDEVNLPLPIAGTTYNIPLSGASLYPGDRTCSTFFGKDSIYTIAPDGDYAAGIVRDKLISEHGFASSVVDLLATEIANTINEKLVIYTPSGIDVPAWPTIMPQVALGLPFNTEIMLRGFSVETPEGDPIKFGGFGGKISLSQFIPIPLFPIAISAGFYNTNVNLADIIKANNSIISLQASFSVPTITLYGGIGLESSDMSVLLKDESGNTLLDFSLEGENKTRTTIGVRLKLLLLSIHADYNVGTYKSFTAGIGLTLR